MAQAEASSRHFGEERAKQISRHLFDSPTGSSGRPLFSYDRTTALCLGESHHGGPTTSRRARSQLNHPGLCSLVERDRSRALPLLVRSERSHADRCAAMKTAMDGPQARFTIERLSHVGKHEQHASVSVSGSGHISLPLRPPFPTPLAKLRRMYQATKMTSKTKLVVPPGLPGW